MVSRTDRALLLQERACLEGLASGPAGLRCEGPPGGSTQTLPLGLKGQLLARRPTGEEIAIDSLHLRVPGQELALDGGCIRKEGFDPARDLFLACRTGEKLAAMGAQVRFLRPAAIALCRHAFGDGDQERLLLPPNTPQDGSEYFGDLREPSRVSHVVSWQSMVASLSGARAGSVPDPRAPSH